MGWRGHSPVWRVEKGETRLPWCDSPVVWALLGNRSDRGIGEAWGKPGQASALPRASSPARSTSSTRSMVEVTGTISCWDPMRTVLDGRPWSGSASLITATPGAVGVGPSEITATSKWSADTAVSGSTIVTRLPSRSSSRPRADANNRGRTAMSTSSGG